MWRIPLIAVVTLMSVDPAELTVCRMAARTAYNELFAPSPPVPPSPSPSRKCDNCNGLGKVGDGTVFVKCPVCNGTGVVTQASESPVLNGFGKRKLFQKHGESSQ